ncbi:MAG TPA: ATP-binding protein [Gemmatimonadaceae bacterium]|jgi:PAS domain S-box-containing protein
MTPPPDGDAKPAAAPASPPVTPVPPVPLWTRNVVEWLAAIVDSSDDAIIGKTLDSTIRSWNRGATRMFGYTPEEAIGRSVTMLIPPDLQDEEVQILSRLRRGERIDHFDTVRLRKDGSPVEISLSVSPICDETGTVIGAAKIARDVTEANRLRRAERELSIQLEEQAVELEQQIDEAQSLQEELEQSNEELHHAVEVGRIAQEHAEAANRAKSQFLATMSHELRTPLNAIGGYVDLLDMGLRGSLTSEQRSDLERIRQNQSMLLHLIEDVLDFAKLESGRLQFRFADFPIDELLRRLETFIAPTLVKKGIAFRFAPCGDRIVVHADRHKVEQILLNLLSNAAKFTDRGTIDVRCATLDHSVEITVVDTGRGIHAHLLEMVFEPFVQGEQNLTRTAEGTGLGLSISRQLARAMGGDVTAISAVGEGSTFTLRLPKASSGAP